MIPFLDLRAQYASLRTEHRGRRARGLAQPATSSSAPPVAALRGGLRRLLRRPQAIAVNTGTSALHLALLAAGIGPGDEVITVAATFVATTAAILYAGATPVFVDVDPATWTMDPAQIEARDHPAHQGDPAGPPPRPPGRHGRDPRHRPAPRHPRHRGCRPGARRGARRRPRRRLRRHRLLQLLPGQEPRRLRRGRRGHDRAMPRSPTGSARSATGARRASTTTSATASTTAWTGCRVRSSA